ncbi:MAG: hypothetical protein NWE88_11155 [Candidatus Bathyarchaeota archaeon]|nr:hypothetical protein [Candidatus Bathyarchaeota archaeon]
MLILVLAIGLLFGILVLHDYLVYRDLMRRLREERERGGLRSEREN